MGCGLVCMWGAGQRPCKAQRKKSLHAPSMDLLLVACKLTTSRQMLLYVSVGGPYGIADLRVQWAAQPSESELLDPRPTLASWWDEDIHPCHRATGARCFRPKNGALNGVANMDRGHSRSESIALRTRVSSLIGHPERQKNMA